MIPEFVERWEARKHEVRAMFEAGHPNDYDAIVKAVVTILSTEGYSQPDPNRITCINWGESQGDYIFLIQATGYGSTDGWYVRVGYGSCSGCDTLEHIRNYDDSAPTEQQVKDYMTLALHIVQGIKVLE